MVVHLYIELQKVKSRDTSTQETELYGLGDKWIAIVEGK